MIKIIGKQHEVDKFIEESLDCLVEGCPMDETCSNCFDCKVKDYNLEIIYNN